MVRAILTDIEGTTSSISFVKDVLFPYARARLPAFIDTHGSEPAVRRQLDATADAAGLARTDTAGIVAVLRQWIDEDRKATPLKALQGMVWQQGYASGQLKGHVYPDAVEALKRWHQAGYALYVYSSGSVQAQKLIFGCSEAGDLSGLFSGYFDTTSGPKREVESYRTIAAAIGLPGEEILFLSDIVQELDAAQQAGLQTIGLAREGGTLAGHDTVASFAVIDLDRL